MVLGGSLWVLVVLGNLLVFLGGSCWLLLVLGGPLSLLVIFLWF